MTKPIKWHICPAKTQISLGIRPDWSESSLSAWRKVGSLATHWAHSEDWSDWADAQADLSLRWAHTHFVGFVMSRPICTLNTITFASEVKYPYMPVRTEPLQQNLKQTSKTLPGFRCYRWPPEHFLQRPCDKWGARMQYFRYCDRISISPGIAKSMKGQWSRHFCRE